MSPLQQVAWGCLAELDLVVMNIGPIARTLRVTKRNIAAPHVAPQEYWLSFPSPGLRVTRQRATVVCDACLRRWDIGSVARTLGKAQVYLAKQS